jgi:hypothetical protein
MRGEKLLRPFIYDNGPDYYQEELSRYIQTGRIGFINRKCEVIIAARFEFVLPFSEGMAAFCVGCEKSKHGEHSSIKGGIWGYVDTTGRTVIAPVYEKANSFIDGRAKVQFDGQEFQIDKDGKPID